MTNLSFYAAIAEIARLFLVSRNFFYRRVSLVSLKSQIQITKNPILMQFQIYTDIFAQTRDRNEVKRIELVIMFHLSAAACFVAAYAKQSRGKPRSVSQAASLLRTQMRTLPGKREREREIRVRAEKSSKERERKKEEGKGEARQRELAAAYGCPWWRAGRCSRISRNLVKCNTGKTRRKQ